MMSKKEPIKKKGEPNDSIPKTGFKTLIPDGEVTKGKNGRGRIYGGYKFTLKYEVKRICVITRDGMKLEKSFYYKVWRCRCNCKFIQSKDNERCFRENEHKHKIGCVPILIPAAVPIPSPAIRETLPSQRQDTQEDNHHHSQNVSRHPQIPRIQPGGRIQIINGIRYVPASSSSVPVHPNLCLNINGVKYVMDMLQPPQVHVQRRTISNHSHHNPQRNATGQNFVHPNNSVAHPNNSEMPEQNFPSLDYSLGTGGKFKPKTKKKRAIDNSPYDNQAKLDKEEESRRFYEQSIMSDNNNNNNEMVLPPLQNPPQSLNFTPDDPFSDVVDDPKEDEIEEEEEETFPRERTEPTLTPEELRLALAVQDSEEETEGEGEELSEDEMLAFVNNYQDYTNQWFVPEMPNLDENNDINNYNFHVIGNDDVAENQEIMENQDMMGFGGDIFNEDIDEF